MAGRLDPQLLVDDAEKKLNDSLGAVSEAVEEALANVRAGDAASLEEAYVSANSSIARIRPVVDDFFDRVMVMDEDSALRKNRLGLMFGVDALFSAIADFTKIRRETLSMGMKETAGASTAELRLQVKNRAKK